MATRAIDHIAAYQNGYPVLYWVNNDPFIVGSQRAAYSGKVVTQRMTMGTKVGAPMLVKYILAKASHIKAWQGKVDDNPFAPSTLDSHFAAAGVSNVMFQMIEKPVTYENMVLKDGNLDIDQDIFAAGAKYKRDLDMWQGTLHLIITA